MQANEQEVPPQERATLTLLSRVASNDPTLTSLQLNAVDNLGARSLDPVRWDQGTDVDRFQLFTEQSEAFVKALSKNTKIRAVYLYPPIGVFLSHNHTFWTFLGALMKLENLRIVSLRHERAFLGREIAGLVKEATKLETCMISCLRFEEQELDCARMVDALCQHPSLMRLILYALDFAIGDDFVEDGTCSATDPNTLASYSLACALTTIPNLIAVSTTGLRFQAETFVELVTKSSIRNLSLKSAALSDEHILPMVEAVMKKNSRRTPQLYLSGPAQHRNVFSQEGWEALFRLARRDPPVKVTATAMYDGEQDDATTVYSDVRLHDDESVQQHLERLEIHRLLRLEEAGFNDFAPDESHDAEWIEVLENVNDDVEALYRVLVAHPTICRSKTLRP